MIGDAFGIQCPFQVAFCSFLLSSACVAATLPYISPESMSSGASSSGKSASGFFTPLKIIMPQKLRLANGKQIKHHGVLFLCIGIFVGVVRSLPPTNLSFDTDLLPACDRLCFVAHPDVRNRGLRVYTSRQWLADVRVCFREESLPHVHIPANYHLGPEVVRVPEGFACAETRRVRDKARSRHLSRSI